MSDQQIVPHQVTKPIQLLAAWLLGLILVNGSFLGAAVGLAEPTWLRPLLAIAAVCNVPVFLGAIFLLQTRFRPEMQEDTFYSQYLQSQLTNRIGRDVTDGSVTRSELIGIQAQVLSALEGVQEQVTTLAAALESSATTKSDVNFDKIEQQISATRLQLDKARNELAWADVRVEVNDLIPDYNEIRSVFRSSGIPVNDTFGSSSVMPHRPRLVVVALSPDVPMPHVKAVLDVLKEFQVHGVLEVEGDTPERGIFVGAYGYHGERVAPLTLIAPEMAAVQNWDEFHRLIRQCSISAIPNLDAVVNGLPEREAKSARLMLERGGVSPQELASLFGVSVPHARRLYQTVQSRLDAAIELERFGAAGAA